MNKYGFLDDYSEGCHPNILQSLSRTNMQQQQAYGEDEYSHEARALIQSQLGPSPSTVQFVAGGTAANLILIASCLRPHEAVISADSGHIANRESGAIEATGHKIITTPSNEGKLTPDDIQSALDGHALAPHMVKPRLVYLSNATELGTLYTKAELTSIRALCKSRGLLLLMDGARLGAALTASSNDLTMADIAQLTDFFWIGGTKAGALIGEALVINRADLADDIDFQIKQRGALLSKGRLIGLQFVELFRSGLFFEAGKHANALASRLSEAITKQGYSLAAETQTNMVFPTFPNALIEHLRQRFDFHLWGLAGDQTSTIRLVTSWATDESKVDEFISQLSAFQPT